MIQLLFRIIGNTRMEPPNHSILKLFYNAELKLINSVPGFSNCCIMWHILGNWEMERSYPGADRRECRYDHDCVYHQPSAKLCHWFLRPLPRVRNHHHGIHQKRSYFTVRFPRYRIILFDHFTPGFPKWEHCGFELRWVHYLKKGYRVGKKI